MKGEASNLTYSNVQVLPDNPFITIIMFGVTAFSVFLLLIIVKGDNKLSDVFERMLVGSSVSRILAVIGISALIFSSIISGTVFFLGIISLFHVSCAGRVWVFMFPTLSVIVGLLSVLENR